MSMQPETFAPGVIQEPKSSLNPNLKAYWVPSGKNFDRVIAIGERVEDGEISWTQARIQNHAKVQRTLYQRLMKSEIDGSIDMPSGVEVIGEGSSRKGHLFTARQDGVDLQAEIGRRMSIEGATILTVSDQKVVIEGMGVPVAVNAMDQSMTLDHLSNNPHPVHEVKALYRGMLQTLPDTIVKNAKHLSSEDTRVLFQLEEFQRKRVRWASLTQDGGMMADEAGQVGNAWIFVVPPNNPLMQTQQETHSMNYDNNGINPYLSILPYDMAHRWAGLGLVHELSHLRDAVLKLEPRVGRTRDQYLEGEHRAYSVERALAFAYSEGRLQQTLEAIVSDALRQGDPMAAINSLVNQRLPAISRSLDMCLEPNQPKSQAELGVRQGLYVMLIGFEVARQTGDPASLKQREKSFIEFMYEPTGHLPKQ